MMSTDTAVSQGQVTVPTGELPLRELSKLRGGLTLWLISMSVPMLVLINVRYLLVGGYVSPSANQVIGGIATVLLLLSVIPVGMARRSAKSGNLSSVAGSYGLAMLLGAIAFILIGAQVVNSSVNVVTHYGETFVTTLGVLDVYVLFALVGALATRMRVKRLNTAINHYWGIEATSIFWWFVVTLWVIMYVQLYLL